MSTVCADVTEKSRKFHAAVLQAIAKEGQIHVAAKIGVDDSTVHRFIADEKSMQRALLILAAAGMKVVPVEMQCFPRAKVAILMELARDHLNQLETVDQLLWD